VQEARYARPDEQFRAAFSNLIVGYWSMEGSISRKETSQERFFPSRKHSTRKELSMDLN
jgi:hypothetical protein